MSGFWLLGGKLFGFESLQRILTKTRYFLYKYLVLLSEPEKQWARMREWWSSLLDWLIFQLWAGIIKQKKSVLYLLVSTINRNVSLSCCNSNIATYHYFEFIWFNDQIVLRVLEKYTLLNLWWFPILVAW